LTFSTFAIAKSEILKQLEQNCSQTLKAPKVNANQQSTSKLKESKVLNQEILLVS
jgi:hypothetical protein